MKSQVKPLTDKNLKTIFDLCPFKTGNVESVSAGL